LQTESLRTSFSPEYSQENLDEDSSEETEDTAVEESNEGIFTTQFIPLT